VAAGTFIPRGALVM